MNISMKYNLRKQLVYKIEFEYFLVDVVVRNTLQTQVDIDKRYQTKNDRT